MGRIVAIGGGELAELETLEIDRYIVNLAGKDKPRALFIPTASGEPSGYIESFNNVYGTILGCETDVLLLLESSLSIEEIRNKILSADIIYVGGGDTVNMLSLWKENKVDVFLREAYEKDIILSGLSAGSICWFRYGHSEISEDPLEFKCIEGLGFINAVHCPHYNEDERKVSFDDMMKTMSVPGFAIEDNCAIEFNGSELYILKSNEMANAYLISKEALELKKELLGGVKTERGLNGNKNNSQCSLKRLLFFEISNVCPILILIIMTKRCWRSP